MLLHDARPIGASSRRCLARGLGEAKLLRSPANCCGRKWPRGFFATTCGLHVVYAGLSEKLVLCFLRLPVLISLHERHSRKPREYSTLTLTLLLQGGGVGRNHVHGAQQERAPVLMRSVLLRGGLAPAGCLRRCHPCLVAVAGEGGAWRCTGLLQQRGPLVGDAQTAVRSECAWLGGACKGCPAASCF